MLIAHLFFNPPEIEIFINWISYAPSLNLHIVFKVNYLNLNPYITYSYTRLHSPYLAFSPQLICVPDP